MTGGTDNDLAVVLQYINGGGDVLFSGNDITVAGGDTGVMVYWSEPGSVTISDNTITGGADGTGVEITSDSIFGEAPDKGAADAILDGNAIDGFGTGILVHGTGTKAVSAQIGGSASNTITSAAGGTGILVVGVSASASIVDNASSITSGTIGIDVDGGNAIISGNAIYDNTTGIRVHGGGTATISGNDFDDATADNATDILIVADAGTVTIADGNQFAGDDYFIDNRTAQIYDLTPVTTPTTSFEVSDPLRDDNFEIEDKMFHGPDDSASGVITWVSGNLFVTTPGTGSSDESIQNAVDAATAGDIVNVEAGSYIENVLINKPVTISGEAESSVDLTGRITLNENADDVVIEDMTILGNSSFIVLVNQAGVENLTLQNVTLDGERVSTDSIHSSEGAALEGAVTLTNITVQGMAVSTDALSLNVRLADGAAATLTDGTFINLPGHVQFRGVGANPTATVAIDDTHWTGGGSQGESALELYDLASVSITGSSMTDFVDAPVVDDPLLGVVDPPVIGVNAFDIGSLTISNMDIELDDGTSGQALTGGIGINLSGTIATVTLTDVNISDAGQAALLIPPVTPLTPFADINAVTIDATSNLIDNGTAPITVGLFAGMPHGDVVVLNDATVTLEMDPTGMVIVEQGPGEVILTAVTQHTDTDYVIVDDDFDYQSGQWFFFDSAVDTQDGWYQLDTNAFTTIQAAVDAASSVEP